MEVIGHRGQVLAGGPSENTAAAVIAAQAAGADGVEVDVRLTRDRVAVCLHDRDLRRLAGHQRRVLRCWTVNRTRDARRLERAGVTAVITDDPGRMLRTRGWSVPLRPVPVAVRATRPRVRVGA